MKIKQKKLKLFKHQKECKKKKLKLKMINFKKQVIWIFIYKHCNNNQDKWIWKE